jgi:hypothetical protein
MKIQELIEKIAEENIQLWDMPQFSLIMRDETGKSLMIKNMKVNKENKTVRIVVGK